MASANTGTSRRGSNDSYASAKSEILLSEDAFNNEHSRQLFEAIDELRGCGANQDIELPELVIVGDQSVGKSSLLQGLTDIPFPVASRLCTRFPTRIVSRWTPGRSEMTKVSIEPKTFSAFEDGQWEKRRQGYEAFSRAMPRMTSVEFKEVVDEATDLMGIKRSVPNKTTPAKSEQRGGRNFSDDVLKIEISGPNRSYFSILDVPGVFHSLTKDLTEKEKGGVRAMVTSYVASKQSVIICVANGTNDLVNQAVFDMVSKQDKSGERTVGVITKCDIAQDTDQVWSESDETGLLLIPIWVMDLARNNEKKFHHGWFVVRNRTPSEADEGIGLEECGYREQQFFCTQPWNELSDTRRGTQALKKYLADILCTRIQQAFPRFLKDIQTLLDSARSDLKSMATARKTIEEKRSYLTQIAQEFEKRASQSVRGRYDSITANEMKLRMKVREANDAFALEMGSNGHTVPFLGETATTSTIPAPGADARDEAERRTFFNSHNSTVRPPCSGTSSIPFQAPQSTDQMGHTDHWQSIPFTNPYAKYSFEELRLSDYLQNMPTSSKPEQGTSQPSMVKQTPTQSPFGLSDQTKQAAHGAFGGNTSSWSFFNPPSVESGLKAPPSSANPGLGGGRDTSRSNIFDTPQVVSGFGGLGALPSQPKQATSGFFGVGSTSMSIPVGAPTQTSAFEAPQNQQKQATSGSSFSSLHTTLPAWTNVPFQKKRMDHYSGIYQWIRDEIKASRGTELQGTLNPDILPILFHKQARKWKKISEAHFLTVTSLTTMALIRVLQCVCTDPGTRQRIETLIRAASDRSMDRGLSQLSARVDTILSKHLQTSNPAFEHKISEARRVRFHAALERYRSTQKPRIEFPSFSDHNVGNDSGPIDDQLLVIDMRDTASLFAELHISNSQNLQDEVHDTLKAYYEIAREDFVEYVNQHIVEDYLDDPQGPVLSFDPLRVAGMTNREIESLAAEDDALVQKRTSKQEALFRLSRAEEIARRHSG